MTDQKTTIVGGEAQRVTVSDEITVALRQAQDRIERIDTDPIIRLALARVAVRAFAQTLAEAYPEFPEELATELQACSDAMRGADALPPEIRRVLAPEDTPAGNAASEGENDAEDRQPVGEAGGRGQADPQGPQPGSASRKSTRHYGSERVRKEHAVLRVGGT
ncbi:MAG: hypothetical protein AAGI03_15870 [Pseudomonadota bacterium]